MGSSDDRRKSLRKRFLESGKDAFYDEELIEALLGYFIKGSKDLTKIALDMKRHFQNMSLFIYSTKDEFEKMRGVDEESALYLFYAGVLCQRAIKQRQTEKVISSPARAAGFLARYFFDAEFESCMVMCLSDDLVFTSLKRISDGNVQQTDLDFYEALSEAVERDRRIVILAHNHPASSPVPSHSDRLATMRLLEAARGMGIILLDHIIFDGTRYYSFADDNFFKDEKEPVRSIYLKNPGGRDIWESTTATANGSKIDLRTK